MIDPTAEAGIDIGQRWRDQRTGDRFTVQRTYRNHPTNPSFRIEWDPPVIRDTSARLGFFTAYCEREEDEA